MTKLVTVDPSTYNRTKFIGGSDIAAVLGISPWRTPYALWQDKSTPRVEDDAKKKVFSRGKRWESVVGEMLVEALHDQGREVEIVSTNRRYIDPSVPYFASEIDFELRLDGSDEITNCELKTVHPFKSKEWGEEGSDTVPLHYLAQVQWGLGVTGRKDAIVAALFGADELRPYPVVADLETIEAMRLRAMNFWQNHVLAGVAPDLVDINDVNKMFSKDSEAPALIADPQLQQLYLRARAINKEIAAREAEFESIEFQIKCAMKDCTELIVERDGESKTGITWKNRAHSWLDQAGLKEQHPKLVREFTRKGESRVFTVK
jgi:putative phage-type endonuclease